MTIVARKGRFGVKVWDQGAKRYRWVGSFDTEAEARLAEADALPQPTHASPTVEQWGRIWLTDYARDAAATRQVYAQAVKWITGAIGRLRLDELDRPAARRLANTWPRNTTAVARTMWEDARRDGVCQENPWANLRLRQSRGRKDIVALTESEVHDLAEVAEVAHGKYGLEGRAMILVLAYTGVRPGELCALRWDDLDARERELHVRRSLDVTGSEKLPKSGKQRIITVPPLALRWFWGCSPAGRPLRLPHRAGAAPVEVLALVCVAACADCLDGDGAAGLGPIRAAARGGNDAAGAGGGACRRGGAARA